MDSNHPQTLPLVLIHAFPLTGTMWTPQIDALGADLTIHAPDLPGFGGEPGLDEEVLSMERMALFVQQLLDARSIDRCILGGLSMGGYVAFACLRTMRDRIAGLILADTRAAADDEETRKGRIAAMERIGGGGYEEYCDLLMQKLLAESTRRTRPEIVATVRRVMLETHPETAVAALLGMLSRGDARDLLPTIDVPTAIIVGEHDAITAVDESRTMAEAIPGATLHVIPNAGHLSNIENPDAFNEAARELVARVDATVAAG
ncbi:MAG TPA: alpha/beta fold hydrolase [Candidatus Kapabacteria bacterium]|nr:alpha/beta fold hydrolase [Candidatus Kapabacteria bacterium]